jgi:glutamate synthase domain-containing protein 2
MNHDLFITSLEYLGIVLLIVVANLYIYDRYVQRRSSLLINYPVIGRLRYFFEILREPMRQYFGTETFYESRDKVDWVYKAAKDVPNFMSFSISQPFGDARFILKHSNYVLNTNEVSGDFFVPFGQETGAPFVSRSVIARSAMSDGALSPEATRAFVMGAAKAGFPINTGEGGLTSNYFVTHDIEHTHAYLTIIRGNLLQKALYRIVDFFFNTALAIRLYRKLLLPKKAKETYIMDKKRLAFYRPDWDAPLSVFPGTVPADMPDIILQIGSGLYGVRDASGTFDPQRYQKAMRFCRMTEIKIAQGAKQTGGKIVGSKVTDDIAYYRGVPEGKDLISPNRFPYAENFDALMDFAGKLKTLSDKPVGIKIVISDSGAVDELAEGIRRRRDEGRPVVDFITLDSGEGGSATAPLEMMESVGLNLENSLYLLDTALRTHGVRDAVRIIGGGKILTPDDAVIMLSLGADMVAIARGFMMSGGCIRARQCAGTGKHICPVGMATQDKKKRASYLVVKKSEHIAAYHKNMLKGIAGLLAIMGLKEVGMLTKKNLAYRNKTGELYFDIEKYFHHKLHV